MNVTFDVYKWINTKKWMKIIIQKEKILRYIIKMNGYDLGEKGKGEKSRKT